VEAIDATTCKLTKLDVKTAATTTTTDPAQPQNAPTPTPSKAGGCGGCSTQPTNDTSLQVWFAFALVAFARRRAPK
jgi:hypothetical protein